MQKIKKTRKKVEGGCPASSRPEFQFFGCSGATEGLLVMAGWKQPCVARVCSAEVEGGGVRSPLCSHGMSTAGCLPVPWGRGVWFGAVDGVLPGANFSVVCGNSFGTWRSQRSNQDCLDIARCECCSAVYVCVRAAALLDFSPERLEQLHHSG